MGGIKKSTTTNKTNMKINYKLTIKVFIILVINLSTNYSIKAQRTDEEKLVKEVGDLGKTVGEIGKSIGNLFKNKKGDSKKGIDETKRPIGSELHDKDFKQNTKNPDRDSNNTRIRIAKNLMIDVKGRYPNGYKPKWRFITYNSNLKFSVEDWVNPKAQLRYEDRLLIIGDYGGKAVIRYKPHFDCECYADIIVKDSFNVITENTQVYEISNFRKILNERSTGEPCVGGLNNAPKGGKGGKITLSANQNGDILMSIMLEHYSLPVTKRDGFHPSQVHFRYFAENITIENEMSAENANKVIEEELEAKRKYANYIKKSEIQIAELMKKIKTKYPGYNCISCFNRSSSYGIQPSTTKTLWSNGEVTEDNDWNVTNTMKIENKCNQELTFIGIQQLYSEENGYYYIDVTRKMEANYYYQTKQGLFMSVFTSLAGMDGDIIVQPQYNISAARVNSIQWIKVIGAKKP